MPHYPKPFFRAQRGVWYIQIDGHQHNLGPGTAEDADINAALLKKALREAPVQPAVSTVADSATVVGLIQKFMVDVRANFAADTIEWYRYRLQLFIDYLFAQELGDLTVAEFKPFYVQEWVNTYTALSGGSKRNYIRAVQRVFNWAEELGHVERSPVARMKKPAGGKREKIISPAEYATILAHTRNDCFRDLLVVTWETGCRPQESLIVEVRHVDLQNGRWYFSKSESKGKKHERVVYLTDAAMDITRRLMLAHPEGPLFRNTSGKPWTTDAVNCAFLQLQIRLGSQKIQAPKVTRKRVSATEKADHLADAAQRRKSRNAAAREQAEKYCLYHFRHSWMNRMLTSGVDSLTVAILAGHVDPSTLATTYQHLSQNPVFLLEQAKRAG